MQKTNIRTLLLTRMVRREDDNPDKMKRIGQIWLLFDEFLRTWRLDMCEPVPFAAIASSGKEGQGHDVHEKRCGNVRDGY